MSNIFNLLQKGHNTNFKIAWNNLTPVQKQEFLNYYNRYINKSVNKPTLTQFEKQIETNKESPDSDVLKRVDDNHFNQRVEQISINTKHPSRKPLHNMVAYLMCNDNVADNVPTFFTFKELERYFNKKNENDKKDLANKKTDGGKIPLEMIFPTKETWFKPATCPMTTEKIKMANDIIELLGPYTDRKNIDSILVKLQEYNRKFYKLKTTLGSPVQSGGYRKRKTHRKTHRKNHRKTRK